MFSWSLPAPSFSVQDVFTGLRDSLARLCDVATLNLNDRLAFYSAAMIDRDGDPVVAFDFDEACALAMNGVTSACYELQPDAVVFISGFFLSEQIAEVIHRNGTKVGIVHTESPYEDDKQISRAGWADMNVVNDPTNLERFPKGTAYLPHAYRPEWHHPNGRIDRFDFSFVGTAYPSRIEFLEKVDFDGLRVSFVGNWSNLPTDSPLHRFVADAHACLDNKEAADLYRSSLTSVNLYRREANDDALSAGWAMGPREVELAACGTWFARDPRGESDAVFPMLPTFTTPDELGELVRWALTHPTERHQAAQAARGAIADRTFDNNAAAVLRLLGD